MLLKDRIEFLNGISISFTGENAHREMNSVIVNSMEYFTWINPIILGCRSSNMSCLNMCNHIPASRLSNLIHGTRKAKKYRKQVCQLLRIEE